MSTNVITPQEKKLKDLRKLLTLCFAGISISIVFLASLPMFLVSDSAFRSAQGAPVGALLTTLVVGLLVLIGVIGVVCLVIYYIFKYRLEKDNELFL
jgi:hypothetical protein